ncbi:cadherin-like protein 26 [Thunnus maccoyii]|uniref:cadherin-like protein 26 n=1 Tax=Thunnus maccoyii TaxID=8240 RepID=UPI001C4A84BF|nr:cadherin-like protein 26 [Thunnus maccoyii]
MLGFLLLIYYLSSVTCSELLSRHRRSWIIDSFTIEEEQTGPFPYVLGKVSIARDYRVYFDLYGQGVDEEPIGVLSIHKESGNVSVHRAVDYEEKTMLKLKFEARKTDLSIDTKLGLEISILDINDNPPRFQRDLYEVSVKEENIQGSNLLTVLAYDSDQSGTPNSTFHYEIKSVSPNPPNTEFFIDESGMISYKGCLDHEVAEMFTVLVEAKDHGEVVSLSSSTTVVVHVQDGNNHLPSIIGQTGPSKVKEHETGSSPLRLHVTDRDTRNSSAWRVKYTIQGDEGEHFKIETDPDTNDGILTVVKALDFEEGAQRELSISVENEAPYFSCEVKEKTTSGLWKVDTINGDDAGAVQPPSVKVIIEVEDVNDPPVFNVTVKEAILEENSPTGTWVEKVTAVDPDTSHARDFVYSVGHDPDGWVTVDPHTGNITTVKSPDRESPHVVNSVYTVLLHAVDNGKPPLTSTATLNIHVTDQNDNVPQLTLDYVDVCLSDDPTTINITAFDLDENPFAGPFTFKLLGDVKGKWTLNPSYGYTAGLVKEPGVYAGKHTVDLEISGMQGEFGVYNLSVTVCDCSVTPNCQNRNAEITAASSSIGIVFASLLLLLFLLLIALVITRKKEFTALPYDDSYAETLFPSNIEKPGIDCKVTAQKHLKTNQLYIFRFPFMQISATISFFKVPDGVLAVSTATKQQDSYKGQSLHDGVQQMNKILTKSVQQDAEQNVNYKDETDYRKENVSHLFNSNNRKQSFLQSKTNWNSLIASGSNLNHQVQGWGTMNPLYKMNSSGVSDTALLALLHWRLSSLEQKEEDLGDYQPHLYAYEEDSDNLSELENITIPDDDSFMKLLTDLGPKFNQLASICKPPHLQN